MVFLQLQLHGDSKSRGNWLNSNLKFTVHRVFQFDFVISLNIECFGGILNLGSKKRTKKCFSNPEDRRNVCLNCDDSQFILVGVSKCLRINKTVSNSVCQHPSISCHQPRINIQLFGEGFRPS